MTWRNESAAWYNKHVANRTWSITPSTSSQIFEYHSSTTIYPSRVSTYKLCDGTPRANVRPNTIHWSGNSTTYFTYMSTVTPTYGSQPCKPDPNMCRLWYYDSDIKLEDDIELLAQCGFPAHLGAPCLIGGGPVRLVYFPVTTVSGNLCSQNGSTIRTHTGTESVVTTLGHTFTSGSVYLSFNTLFATYDGFWNHIGPTFSNYILPLPSSAISTQCSGQYFASGPGTPLNYADLNWPVPASAYACQYRCSATLISFCSASICDIVTKPKPPECSTIWSDVNPDLAVPTQVRGLVPEWSTCSFWDQFTPNIWFDPPVVLHTQPAVVTPAMGPTSVTTSAAPRSTAKSPLPRSTATSRAQHHATTTIAGTEPGPKHLPTSKTDGASSPSQDNNSQTEPADSTLTQRKPKPQPESDTTTFVALSILSAALSSMTQQADPSTETEIPFSTVIDPSRKTSADPRINTLAVGSVTLTASMVHQSTAHAVAIDGSTISIGGPEATIHHHIFSQGTNGLHLIRTRTSKLDEGSLPALTPARSGIQTLTAGSVTMTASFLSRSDAMVVGGKTLSIGGEVESVSGIKLSLGSSGAVLVNSHTTVTFAKATDSPPPAIVAAASVSTVVADDFTFTAAFIPGSEKAVSIASTTLFEGGAPVAIHGATLSEGSSGLLLLESKTSELFTATNVDSSSRPSDETSYVASATLSSSRSYPETTSSSKGGTNRCSVPPTWILWISSFFICCCSTWVR